MMGNKSRFHFGSFCLGIVAVILLVQAGGSLQGNRIVFPDVREIGKAFLFLLGQGSTWKAVSVTLLHLAEALAISFLAGTALGLAEGFSDRVRSGLMPVMTLLRSLPMIVLAILMMTLFPYQYVPSAAASLVLIPMVSEAVSEGVRSIEPEMKDVYRLNSNFSGAVLVHVYIPMISGYLKQAFFNAAGTGLKVAVTAEYLVQTRNSLGKAVYSSSYFLDYAEIYAYALIMILLILMLTEVPAFLFRQIEKRTEPSRICIKNMRENV